MGWKLDGTYFENCNCDWVCPCTVTSFASPATGDRCQVVLNYHVGSGDIDGVNVDGLSVALVADTPKQMVDGNWRVGLLIDQRATADQGDRRGAPVELDPHDRPAHRIADQRLRHGVPERRQERVLGPLSLVELTGSDP